MIRKLRKEEFTQAAELSLEVFSQCGAEDFNTEVGNIRELCLQ